MKTFKSFNIYFLFVLLLTFLFQSLVLAQPKRNSWQHEWVAPKSFIENKGQFNIYQSGEKVLFAYDNGSTMIYFTKAGVRYSFLKRWLKQETDVQKLMKLLPKFSATKWKEEEEEKQSMKYESEVVSYEWLNASPDVQIVGVDETRDYHSYDIRKKDGSDEFTSFIKAYKKIVYKNIYPNIDIEFGFHPVDGIEYAVILHPGADLSKFKISYSKNFKIDSEGNIRIQTKFGDIIEHAPHTYYADNKNNVIKSGFIKEDKNLSFKLDAYNNTQEVIIDPWVHTPALTNSNGVWECERDAAGNVYIIGGDMPMKLQKYDSTGALQWTYNTPWDTANYWLGTIATDLQGNSYITSGSVANLRKITTNNVIAWSASSTVGSANEYWNIAFNCDQTKLIVGGTKGNMNQLEGAVFDINASNGVINSSVVVGWGNMNGIPPSINEVRSITSSPNSRYYFLTLDTIGSIFDNFSSCNLSSPVLFRKNSTYNLAYKCENYRPNNGNAGIMAIKAGNNFLYTQNGVMLHKRSLTTGAILDSAAIPGGISTTTLEQKQVGNSGIDIDSCGNVYMGSGDRVIKYDINLNIIDSVITTFKVSDVAVSNGGNVIICGTTGTSSSTNRTGYIQSVYMSACSPTFHDCSNVNICPIGPFCNNANSVALIVDTLGGFWSGPGVDSATGIFNPATAGVGIHTIFYTLPNSIDSTIIQVDSCITLNTCRNNNGSIMVSGGTPPYTWQTQTVTTDCSACPNGICNPPFCNGVLVVTWNYFSNSSTIIPPVSFPLRVIDFNGNSAIFPSLLSVPACSPCVGINLVVSNISNALCIGGSDGSFVASTSGWAGPFNYTLLLGGDTIATRNNVITPQTFNGLTAGTYLLFVNADTACTDTATVVIGENVFTVNASSNSPVCYGQAINFTAGGGSLFSWTGPNGYSSNLQNPHILNAHTGGNYYVTISSPPCSVVVALNVVVNSKPSNPYISYNHYCDNTPLQLISNSITGVTYFWSGPAGFTSNQQNPVINNFHQANAGLYSLYVKTASGCNSDTISLTVNFLGNQVVNLGSDFIFCNYETVILNAGSAFTSYLWSDSTTSQTIAVSGSVMGLGTHTIWVNVTDINGCISSDSVNVTFQDCSGIEEISASDLKIFPNPANSSVHVILPNDFNGKTLIQILDVTGKVIINENVADKNITININQLSAGIYYIRVLNNDKTIVKELFVE